jgi:hypothetical protein
MSREDAPSFRQVNSCYNCQHYHDGLEECQKHKFSLDGLLENLSKYKICDDWEEE